MAQFNLQQNNIVTYRGDDFSTQLIFCDADGNAINITGWKIFFTAKKNKTDTDAMAPISVTIDPTDPTHGIALVVVSHTVTDTLSGLYYYDFKFRKADMTIQTIVSGGITFETNVTRRTS
jgi:hypothetical protein